MPSYFYTDGSGQRLGPIDDRQLQVLALQGTITPHTQLETDAGHKGVAGQIPGLRFPTQASPNTPAPRGGITHVTQMRFKSDAEETPIFSLLFDFSFRELRPETIYLWVVKVAYATGVVVAILGSLFYCGLAIYTAFSAVSVSNGLSLLTLLTLPFIGVGCFLVICLLRFSCDWAIIITHCMLLWTVEIAKLLKAARIYLDEKSGRQ